jgi:hypothetical protein
MSRFVQQLVSSLTVVGYLLVVTWGSAWHEHHHGHCHAHAVEVASDAAHSHAGCCSHHHAKCEGPQQPAAHSAPANSPCHAPLHDEDCAVCQILAHPPLAPPAIELVDAGEPVAIWVLTPAPSPAWFISPVYDSRGPPLV